MSIESVGSNFQVNTNAAGNQTGTGIVALDDGRFYLAWLDANTGRLTGQLLDQTGAKSGGEFDIGPGSGGGFVGSLKLENGGFVIHTEHDFMVFDATGTLVNGGVLPLNNQSGGASTLTATKDGFVVGALVNGYVDIGVQPYDFSGEKIGAQFTIPSGAYAESVVKEVVSFGNGGYGLVYDQVGTGVLLQRFDSLGNPAGGPVQLSSSTTDIAFHSQIDAARLPDGRSFVAWSQDGYIHGALLDASGSVIVSDFLISEDSPGGQLSPHVTVTAGGRIAVAWSSGGSAYSIMLNGSGSPVSDAVELGDGMTAHWTLFSTALPTGGVLYTWRATDGDGEGPKLRSVNEAGDLDSEELRYNDVTEGHQYADAVAINHLGIAVATFNGVGDSEADVFAQVFQTSPGVAPTGPEGSLPTVTEGDQDNGTVIGLAGGGFIGAWVDLASGQRKAHLLDTNGNKVGNEILLGTQSGGWVQFLRLDNGNVLLIADNSNSIEADLLSSTGDVLRTDISLFDNAWSYLEFATAAGGGFIAASSSASHTDIQSRLFDENGDPVGDTYTVPSGTYNEFVVKEVVGLDGGGYLLIYKPPGGGIVVQHFDAAGEAQGAPSQISSLTTDVRWDDDLDSVKLDDGRIFVTWSQPDPSSGDREVFGRFLDATGAAASSEFVITAGIAGDQIGPRAFLTNDGHIAVAWYSGNYGYAWDSGSNTALHVQLFDETGDPIGSEQILSDTPTGPRHVMAAPTADGGLMFVWRGFDSDNEGVRARYLSASGVAGSEELLVNTVTSGRQIPTAVSVDPNGNIVVVYSELGGNDGSGSGVFYRTYEIAGAPNADPTDIDLSSAEVDEFVANGTLIGTLSAVDPDSSTFTYTLVDNLGGRFVIVGDELRVGNGLLLDHEQAGTHEIEIEVSDGSGGTRTETFTITVGDVNPEYIVGTGADETFVGGALSDMLDGAGGVDTLAGGLGDDTYYVNLPADTVTEVVGEGRDRVFARASYELDAGQSIELFATSRLAGTVAIDLTGNELGQVMYGNMGANTLSGGGGPDRIFGFGGHDILDGGAGNDTVDGGEGNDTLVGGPGTDTLTGGLGEDIFVFNAAFARVDTITDFTLGDDTIQLASSIFVALSAGQLASTQFVIGSAAADGDDHIIYNSVTGGLFYDADGLGGTSQVQFASLTTMSANDITVV